MGKHITKEEIAALNRLVELGEMSREDAEDAIIDGTPQLWAETYLCNPKNYREPLVLRPKQHELLGSSASTICVRWGRQSGKSVALIVRLLWEGETESNTRCLVFAPRKKHIADLFNYAEIMAKGSDRLRNSILDTQEARTGKKIKNPKDSVSRIRFKNGSVIVFFWTQSKVALEMIRGTEGGKIFLEETPLIHADAFTALSGVITSAEEILIYSQGTPGNKEGWYYDFSLNAEFHSHQKSSESPEWSDIKEKAARLAAPDEGSYQREFNAEFVSDGWTAFTDTAVDTAIQMSEYDRGNIMFRDKRYLSTEQMKNMPGKTFIGIDWNISANGTKIIIMKEPVGNKGKLYYQEVISIEHPTYTQITAIDKLFELIDELRPDSIAVDEGFGHVQIELISKKLEEPEYAWVQDRFAVVNFREVIHIPIEEFFGTGQLYEESFAGSPEEEMRKMPMKAFMVSIFSRMMLSGNIAISPIDIELERKTLANELRSVKIEKISPEGYPVYSKNELHKFAAALLCVYAYFKDAGGYYIVRDGKKKILRKSLDKDFQISTILNLRNSSVANTLADRINPPYNSFGRRIQQNTHEKKEMTKEDYADLGLRAPSTAIERNIKPKRAGYLSFYNRRKGPGRRSI